MKKAPLIWLLHEVHLKHSGCGALERVRGGYWTFPYVHLLAADVYGLVDERLVTGAAISGHEGLGG